MTAEGMHGVIVKGIGGFYYIRDSEGQLFTLRARGVFRKQKITPMIGDRVVFKPGEGEDDGWIEEILPRSNMLVRPPVANVAYLVLVVAPTPKPDLLLIDTLLVQARRQGIAPALVINKADLDLEACHAIQNEYRHTGDPVFLTSVKQPDTLQALGEFLQKGICCFAGQSGVGKSSLVSAITGISLDTGEISRKTERGKHNTRHAELLQKDSYRVLDTAGFSLLLQDQPEDPVYLKEYYPEFSPYEPMCRFQPCYHQNEPGCAVLQAVKNAEIAAQRVARYHQLLENAKEVWKGRYE